LISSPLSHACWFWGASIISAHRFITMSANT
jgi:hypothetical protein